MKKLNDGCAKIITDETLRETISHGSEEYPLKRAAKLLSETETGVSVIAQTAGFENVGYFCRKFKALYGMTPKEYRDHRRSERK